MISFLALRTIRDESSKVYKKCSELRFCNDNLNVSNNRWAIDNSTVVYNETSFSSKLLINETKTEYTFHAYSIASVGIRFFIELPSEQSSYRFSAAHQSEILNQQVLNSKGSFDVEYSESLTSYVISDGITNINIRVDPFTVTVYQNGNEYLKLNSEQMLFIENGTAEDSSWHDWIETYPNGKTGLGIDLVFPDKDCRLTGFPERHATINIEDTLDEPIRRFAADSYSHYGSIPIITAHGSSYTTVQPSVLWLNPTDTWINVNTNYNGRKIQLISEGSFIDMIVLIDTPNNYFKKLANLTGLPPVPPAFAFGYHQSKYGYFTQDEVEEVLDQLSENEIPHDCIWLDVDHLDGYAPFKVNSTAFPEIQNLFSRTAKENRYVVRLSDPHLPTKETHKQFKEANEKGYLVTNKNGTLFKDECWPGESAWPDFFREEVRDWWSEQYHYGVDEDAPNVFFWNDMNEPASFGTAEGTFPKDVTHMENTIEHREVHSAYGLFMTVGTFKGLSERDELKNLTRQRPFILTRSFFTGSQKYAWTWSGDNDGNWESLQKSIDILLMTSLGGMPFSGSDVGGFNYVPSNQLLARWFQVGAFAYPFFREHSRIDLPHREPYLYKNDTETYSAIKSAIENRYRLGHFWYTAGIATTETGKPPVLPMWVDCQGSEMDDVRFQFLVDGKLMVCPVVYENATSIEIIKPEGIWYDFWTGSKLTSTRNVSVSLGDVPVFIKGGSIIPLSDKTMTFHDAIRSDVGLIIVPDSNGKASGRIYVDDGVTMDYESSKFLDREIVYNTSGLYITKRGKEDSSAIDDIFIRKLTFYSESAPLLSDITFKRNGSTWTANVKINMRYNSIYRTDGSSNNYNFYGIIIGVVVVVLILIVAGITSWCLLVKRKSDKNVDTEDNSISRHLNDEPEV